MPAKFVVARRVPDPLERGRPQAGDRRRTGGAGRLPRGAWPTRSARTSTPFDLICHVAFDQPPLTRRERADNVRKRNDFAKYGEQARAVLDALLDKYADEGIDDIEDIDVLKVEPLTGLGTPVEIVRALRRQATLPRRHPRLEAALYAA